MSDLKLQRDDKPGSQWSDVTMATFQHIIHYVSVLCSWTAVSALSLCCKYCMHTGNAQFIGRTPQKSVFIVDRWATEGVDYDVFLDGFSMEEWLGKRQTVLQDTQY